ncbi:hypothetical protein [Streptomyces scabiei]|uniref:Uncharacterized protein n=1 Tax=Streptomyces scabiei TaxID=1930 RepID=A0A100JRK0_STRSC|nr:hypothetical protein [Streptomyces scabiei]GAQ64362.1 hypothetical protein SsS58_04755 [Streptomyces scabiei]
MTALSPHLRQATPVVAARGEGVHLFDEDNRRHLDFTIGIGVPLGPGRTRHGPRPPGVTATVARALNAGGGR